MELQKSGRGRDVVQQGRQQTPRNRQVAGRGARALYTNGMRTRDRFVRLFRQQFQRAWPHCTASCPAGTQPTSWPWSSLIRIQPMASMSPTSQRNSAVQLALVVTVFDAGKNGPSATSATTPSTTLQPRVMPVVCAAAMRADARHDIMARHATIQMRVFITRVRQRFCFRSVKRSTLPAGPPPLLIAQTKKPPSRGRAASDVNQAHGTRQKARPRQR